MAQGQTPLSIRRQRHLGRVVDVERRRNRLEAASCNGVRTLIVRAGDFFGAPTSNSWFAQGLIKPGKPVRSILYQGKPTVGHAWAYLPDVAATIAQLLEREAELDSFDVFHFAGHWCEPGVEMGHAIQARVGEPTPSIRQFPWALPYALSPFVTVFR